MVESLNNAIVPGGPFFLKTIQVFELAYLSGIRVIAKYKRKMRDLGNMTSSR